MTTAQSMTATARPEHRSPVDPDVRVVNASNEDLRAELDYRNVGTPQMARAELLARAESYASDADKFERMLPASWAAAAFLSAGECERAVVIRRTLAADLRKVADSL